MTNGWISLHRSVKEHWIYANNDYFAAWIKMLLTVNFKDGKPQMIKGVSVDCKRGQSTNSLDTWVALLGKGWSKQRVRTFFKLLERDKIINTENLKVTTRLTICKYDDYQSLEHDSNTQATREQHASNTQATSIEEGNKNKKGKRKESIPPSGDEDDQFNQFWAIYPKKQSKLDARKKFDKAMKIATLPELLESLNKQKLSLDWTKEDGRYIPQPSTWLNKGMWLDEEAFDAPVVTKKAFKDLSFEEKQAHFKRVAELG